MVGEGRSRARRLTLKEDSQVERGAWTTELLQVLGKNNINIREEGDK